MEILFWQLVSQEKLSDKAGVAVSWMLYSVGDVDIEQIVVTTVPIFMANFCTRSTALMSFLR